MNMEAERFLEELRKLYHEFHDLGMNALQNEGYAIKFDRDLVKTYRIEARIYSEVADRIDSLVGKIKFTKKVS
jgi:hypothetical protein